MTEATMASVKKKLLETLEDLSSEELEKYKLLLPHTGMEKGLQRISRQRLETADVVEIVEMMMETYDQQTVEVHEEVLMKMNRRDLVEMLSKISLELRGEHFVEKYQVDLIKRVNKLEPILNEFLREKVITPFRYYEIHSLPTSQKKMTALFSGPLQSSQGKAMFYKFLNKHEPYLMDELRRTEVATMAVKETLKDLSPEDLRKFKWLLQFPLLQLGLSQIPWEDLDMANRADQLVDLMVQKCGQQYVAVIKEVLMDMNRTDLVQRLSETSSGLKEKHSVDEPWSALIQKQVETIESDIQLLLETLAGLSDGELQKFEDVLLSEIDFRICPSDYLLITFEVLDKENLVLSIVLSIVLIYGQQSVYKTNGVLKEMNRPHLVWRLLDSWSGPKEKLSDEHRSALIRKVATKSAVKQLILETMKKFSYFQFGNFYQFLQLIVSQKNLPDISLMLRRTEDRAGKVDLMMQTYGYQSVDLTREVVHKMSSEFEGLYSHSDLKQLFHSKKPSVDEQQPALSERAATTTSVHRNLLEILEYINDEDLEKFKQHLQYTTIKKGLPKIPRTRLETADRVGMVKLMMETYDQESVEVTMEILMKMNRRDLVEMFSETSSRLTVKRRPQLIQKEEPMALVMFKLLETLEALSYEELEEYKLLLPHTGMVKGPQQTRMKEGLQRIPKGRLMMPIRFGIVDLMMEIYDQQSVEVNKEILMKMNRRDLVERWSGTSSGSKRPARSLDHEDCGSSMQVSRHWTKLNPEVITNDADEAPTYSLQSEAGTFECSVSGMRWICKGKVSFKYQFCPLEEHMESIKRQQYMPAGPLMDITVIAGKLDEVYLPHWICIDDNPTILDKFAVLHIDDCGVVVEKVSEVTSSHVKLCEPVFSPRAVLMRVGFSVKINCNVLIYKTNTAFLTLHVYLIPRDPGLQQEMDKREMDYGYKVIRKPYPEMSLKIHDRFILTADLEGAEMNPKDLKLRYESRTPNFFEVYKKNPDRDFTLNLDQKKERQQVWTCTIRKDEYQSTGHKQETDVTRYYTKTAKKAITDALENLSKKNFDSFCEELLDRREEPRVKRNMVEGQSELAVGNVLVDTFTEAKAPGVVVELLRKINCHEEADKLAQEKDGKS